MENHGTFSCCEHWNGEHGVNMSFCTEVDWVMHGSITKWPLTLSLSRFKKHLSSSLEPPQPSYLAGISLELHLVAARPHRTGCEGPNQSMSAQSVHYIRMSVPSVPTTSLWSASLYNRPNTSVFWIRWKSVQTNTVFGGAAATCSDTPRWHYRK